MIELDVIFVYAGQPDNTSNISPYTITRELNTALVSTFRKVDYIDWNHIGELPATSKDTILLLHPNYPHNTPAWRLFDENVRLKTLIFPFHHAIPEFNLPFNSLVKRSDAIFSITAERWYNTIDKSSFADWKDKITRVDMAVDDNAYSYVRKEIKGRDFVYIGCDRPEKNIQLLYNTFKSTDAVLHTYGNISHNLINLPNVIHHGYVDTNNSFASDLCDKCVMFINPSISDACPTTLLEAAAWGLIVACTEGSGYYYDKEDSIFWRFSDDDIGANVNLINYVRKTDEKALLTQMAKARAGVVKNHNWNKFTSTIISKLKDLI